MLNGLKLKQTVEDAGIKSGQVVYVEFLQPNNTWPTDNFSEKERDRNKTEIRPNLGPGILNQVLLESN